MNNNESEDVSIFRMVDPLKSEILRIKSDPEIADQHERCVAAHRRKIDALRATARFAEFFDTICSQRMRRLSRMHRFFGGTVFLAGPEVIPDDVVFENHSEKYYFTVEAQPTRH